MFYHNILHDDMRNGDGLRVTLFVSGCNHHCKNCQNPQTWDKDSGIEFDIAAKEEIFEQLNKDYISGITLSGGDPLYEHNLDDIYSLVCEIKDKFPTKTIWIYTGYGWEEVFTEWITDKNQSLRRKIIELCDVLVDGRYVDELSDINYHWAGSTNQRILDTQKSLQEQCAILHGSS